MVDLITCLDPYDIFITKLKNAVDDIGDRIIPIVYSDIKHFKYFNDTYGYKLGDDLIAEFAELVCKDNSYITGARVVSDNIVTAGYVSNKIPRDDMLKHIRQVNDEIEEYLCKKFKCRRISIATGVYFITAESKDINVETAISNANFARKQAKESKDESVIFFDDTMAERINRELDILASIKDALSDKELMPYYQPKVNSITGLIEGAEALVRWRKPDGTFIYPDQFIPAIEKSGQITDVDYYMYEEVFRFIKNRLDNGEPIVPISLNVSRAHLTTLNIIGKIKDLLVKYPIPTEYVEFELTETSCMENPDSARQFIDAMHELGIKVSMDDFGSGYSSLNLLSEIPFDIIKLDRTFLKSKIPESKERIIISSIVTMSRELGMKSLCEGVETEGQSIFLKNIGCNTQQGFLFSKPIPQTEFEALLI
ncbi:MAG: EAL domain-containing protein [Lachnospiraceae bacterium]|nr:EAL domain-containing protein [Lachnospiraceae bacterium]